MYTLTKEAGLRFASYYDRNEDLYEEMARDRQTDLLGMIGKSAVSVHVEIYNVWLMVNHTVLVSFKHVCMFAWKFLSILVRFAADEL